MQMLEAGGVPVLTDKVRQPDDDNQRGYYEHEDIKKIIKDSSWLESSRGKAVKIVTQLLPNLRQGEHYRVIYMERSLKTVIASQTKMLARLGRSGGRLSDHRLAETYIKQVDGVRSLLLKNKDQVQILSINYSAALENPASIAAQVNSFLGGNLNEQAMAATIDLDLQHQDS
jgi:hypothetical protein